MGRNRKQSKDNWMPPGVRFDGFRYILRSKLTNGKAVRLCGKSATQAHVWAAYEAHRQTPDDTLDLLCREYMKSPQYCALAAATQNQYRTCSKSLQAITFNGGMKLMALPPAKITPGILQQILDLRIQEGRAVSGNREIKGFLSAVYAWGLARDRIKGVMTNPCRQVKRAPESARMHYVEDWEFELAKSKAPAWLSRVMELTYLLYGRITEALTRERRHVLDEGVYMDRLKGSKDNIVLWSNRLRSVVDECLNRKITSLSHSRLLTNDKGKAITYSMLKKPWLACMAECAKENPDFRPFTRHDLKRKGMTDQDREQNSAGHKTEAMRQRYKVKPNKVEPAK